MIVELADGREFRLPDDSEETKVDELVKALLRAESTAAAALATAQALQAEVASLRKQVEAHPGNEGTVEYLDLIHTAIKDGSAAMVRAQLADTVLLADEYGEMTRSKKVSR